MIEKITRRGLMFIISAPSGAGKTTLTKLLCEADEHIFPSISVTTRSKRPNEKEDVDYIFRNEADFMQMIEKKELLEYAKVFDNYYGTPKSTVEKRLEKGEDVLFDIEWQGQRQLTNIARDDAVSIFMLPPSKEELLRRLEARSQDNHEVIKKRLEYVNTELSHWQEYDYVIINRQLDDSLNKLLSILKAERLKKARRLGLPAFVNNLMTQSFENKV